MRWRMAVVLMLMLSAGLLAACGGAPTSENPVGAIKQRGVLRAGIAEPSGVAADLAQRIADEILGPAARVQLVQVSEQAAGGALDRGELDLVIFAADAILTKREHTELARLVDDLIARMTERGELDDLREKWGLDEG